MGYQTTSKRFLSNSKPDLVLFTCDGVHLHARSGRQSLSDATPRPQATERSRLRRALALLHLITFVPCNLFFDLFTMTFHIGPCIRQILSPQGRIGPKQISFACTESSRLLKQPNRDARPDNARLPTRDSRTGFNPRERLAQIIYQPLQQRAFSARVMLASISFDPCMVLIAKTQLHF